MTGHIPIHGDDPCGDDGCPGCNHCLCDIAAILAFPYMETMEALVGLNADSNAEVVTDAMREWIEELGGTLNVNDKQGVALMMSVFFATITALIHRKDVTVCDAVDLMRERLRERITVDAETILNG